MDSYTRAYDKKWIDYDERNRDPQDPFRDDCHPVDSAGCCCCCSPAADPFTDPRYECSDAAYTTPSSYRSKSDSPLVPTCNAPRGSRELPKSKGASADRGGRGNSVSRDRYQAKNNKTSAVHRSGQTDPPVGTTSIQGATVGEALHTTTGNSSSVRHAASTQLSDFDSEDMVWSSQNAVEPWEAF